MASNVHILKQRRSLKATTIHQQIYEIKQEKYLSKSLFQLLTFRCDFAKVSSADSKELSLFSNKRYFLCRLHSSIINKKNKYEQTHRGGVECGAKARERQRDRKSKFLTRILICKINIEKLNKNDKRSKALNDEAVANGNSGRIRWTWFQFLFLFYLTQLDPVHSHSSRMQKFLSRNETEVYVCMSMICRNIHIENIFFSMNYMNYMNFYFELRSNSFADITKLLMMNFDLLLLLMFPLPRKSAGAASRVGNNNDDCTQFRFSHR